MADAMGYINTMKTSTDSELAERFAKIGNYFT